jgi:RNA polymerase sigma-B factor
VANHLVRTGVDVTTQNEERRLFASLRADPCPATRERAFQRYLPLARTLAGRYRHSEEPIEDLEQVASIGLLKAIDRFESDRGTAFSSFAVPTILGELRRHFRDTTWALRVPRQLQELTLKIEHGRSALTNRLGRQPTIAELSSHLDTNEELILQALDLMVAKYALSLDQPDDDEAPSEPAPGNVDDGYARAEDRATLAPLLATLSAAEAEIVLLRFREDLTQDAIARRVGVSQMHVSRVLYRSIAKLRDAADTRAGVSAAEHDGNHS